MKTKIFSLFVFVLFFATRSYSQMPYTYHEPSTGSSTAGTGGYYNTFIGHYAGSNSTNGNQNTNTFVGFYAGNSMDSGNGNCFFGSMAGRFNTSGTHNTFIGENSGTNNLSGSLNYMGGYLAGTNNASGSQNVFLGYGTGGGTTGSFNTFIGAQSGAGGNYNASVGFGAGQVSSGENNVTLGTFSGGAISGNHNMAFGTHSGSNMTGSFNVVMGYYAAASMTGTSNVLLGNSAGSSSSGSANVFIGGEAGGLSGGNTTGSNNVAIGYRSARNLTSGTNNIFLGYVDLGTAGTTSNSIILADNAGTQKLYIASNGNAGIGLPNNTIPQNKLEVKSANLNNALTSSGLRLTNLKNTITPVTNPSALATKGVLSVDANGDVILVADAVGSGGTTVTAGTNVTVTGNGTSTPYVVNATWPVYVGGTNVNITGSGTTASPYVIASTASADTSIYLNNGDLVNTAADNIRKVNMNDKNLVFDTATSPNNGRLYIGSGYATTGFPTTFGNYRLYVEGGILAERVKVAMSNTANWADYVFADNYKLMPLKEVEAFVKENKHLPGVASSEELAKNGLDLALMQSKQMEKIEELTLHLIEQDKNIDAQHKTIEKQSEEIAELKAQVKLLLGNK